MSQSYPPQLAKAYNIFADLARELRAEAISQGLPIPHADQSFDDGLPGEQTRSEEDSGSITQHDWQIISKNEGPWRESEYNTNYETIYSEGYIDKMMAKKEKSEAS